MAMELTTPGILAHPALDFAMHANWSGIPFRVMRAVLGKDSEAGHGIIGTPTDQHSAPCAMTEEFTSVYRLHPLVPDEMDVRRLGTAAQERCELVDMQGHGSRKSVGDCRGPMFSRNFSAATPRYRA